MERNSLLSECLSDGIDVGSAGGCGSEPLTTVIVGTYTDECASRGVYSYYFDQEKGMLVGGGTAGLFTEAPGRSVGLR